MRGTMMNGEVAKQQRDKKWGNKKYLWGQTNIKLL
jgi:hypothetical protein